MITEFKSVKNRVLISLTVIFVIAISILASTGIFRLKHELNNSYSKLSIETLEIFNAEVERGIDFYDAMIKDTFDNYGIIDAVKNRDNQKLYSLIFPRYQFLKNNNSSLYIMHFHDTQNKTILRLHRPEKFDDDLTNIRPIIREVNNRLIKAHGFESGKHGFFYRIVSPILSSGEHLGALEIGLEINYFSNAVRRYIPDAKAAFLIKNSEFTNTPNSISGYSLNHSSDVLFSSIIKNIDLTKSYSIVSHKGKKYIVVSSLVLKSYDGKDSARMIIARDVTSSYNKFLYDTLSVIILSFISLAVTIFLINKSFSYYHKKISNIDEELTNLYDLFNKGQTIIFRWNYNNNMTVEYVSENCLTLIGFEKKYVESNSFIYDDLIHPSDRKRYLHESENAIKSNAEYIIREPYRIKCKNGIVKWALDHTRIIRDKDGNVLQLLGHVTDVTHLVETQKSLSEIQERLKLAIDGSRDGLWDWDIAKGEVFYSTRWLEIAGYQYNSIPNKFSSWEKLIHKDDYKDVMLDFDKLFSGEKEYIDRVYRIVTPENITKWILLRGKGIYDKNGNAVRALGFHTDITLQMKLEQEQNKYLGIIDTNIMTASVSLDWKTTKCSTAFRKFANKDIEEIINKNFFNTFIYKDDIIGGARIKKALEEQKDWSEEVRLYDAEKWIRLKITKETDSSENLTGYSLFMYNITEKKLVEELSITDSLTKLYNRRFFNSIIETEIRRASRENEYLSLIILDIDHFKQYNDTYGHPAGDKALETLGQILKDCLLRASDYGIRLGGEEFAVLFFGQDDEKSSLFAETLRQRIEQEGIEHKASSVADVLTVSLGLSVFRGENIPDGKQFYMTADKALYEAKNSGRNRVVKSS